MIAFVPDLMDRSKVSAAAAAVGIETRFVRSPEALVAAAATLNDAELVVVDLGRADVLEAVASVLVAAPGARIIGFAPHVDDDLLASARVAGCVEAMPRSRFFTRLPVLLVGR